MSVICRPCAKDFIRKKNKWLLKVHTWIKEHGGGVMIPFSVEFEEELWALRGDPDGRQAFLDAAEGAKSSMPKVGCRNSIPVL